jgi:hypothetical protein
MYRIYYILQHKSVSVHEATDDASLDELPKLLALLKSTEDVVMVMVYPKATRVKMRINIHGGMLVTIDASQEGCSYTRIYSNALFPFFVSAFDELVADPISAGFDCESF